MKISEGKLRSVIREELSMTLTESISFVPASDAFDNMRDAISPDPDSPGYAIDFPEDEFAQYHEDITALADLITGTLGVSSLDELVCADIDMQSDRKIERDMWKAKEAGTIIRDDLGEGDDVLQNTTLRGVPVASYTVYAMGEGNTLFFFRKSDLPQVNAST